MLFQLFGPVLFSAHVYGSSQLVGARSLIHPILRPAESSLIWYNILGKWGIICLCSKIILSQHTSLHVHVSFFSSLNVSELFSKWQQKAESLNLTELLEGQCAMGEEYSTKLNSTKLNNHNNSFWYVWLVSLKLALKFHLGMEEIQKNSQFQDTFKSYLPTTEGFQPSQNIIEKLRVYRSFFIT